MKLRDLKLVEEFAGADGRLRFATTQAFLQRFGLASLQELTAASVSTIGSIRNFVFRAGLFFFVGTHPRPFDALQLMAVTCLRIILV